MMRITKRSAVLALSLGVIALAGTVHAEGTAPGQMYQILQDKDQIPAQIKKREQPVIEQEVKKPAPVEAEGAKKVLVRKFDIQGNTLLDAATLDSATAMAVGKELSLEEIWNVAELVTAKYREAGYLIANAYVPSQGIIDGVVTIQVVEGRVGEILVTGNKSYSTAFIKRHLNEVRRDRSLNEETLEKELLILNDYPSLAVKASLKAGKEAGTTDLIAAVTDRFPISGSISYDNFGSETTSKKRVSVNLNAGNLLTSGDALLLRGVTGVDRIDFDRLSFGRVEYLLPIGGCGTQVGGYYTNSIYTAGGILAPLALQGRGNVFGFYASRPFIRKRDEILNIRLGTEFIDTKEDLLDGPRSRDAIRKIILNAYYTKTDRFLGRNFLGFSYAAGLGSLFGGTEENDVPSPSRAGASDSFHKFNLDAMRIQKLPGYNHIILRGGAQYSPDRLLVPEQFLIGGDGTVRGYTPAAVGGDSGYYLSAELAVSPIFPEATIFKQKVGDTIKFAMFVDHGGAFVTDATAGERDADYLTGLGAGVRLYGGQFFSFKLDWAVPSKNGGYEARNGRTTFVATLSF